MTGYDVVIVGGGSAGAVLAARLSEDPARRVLLLESGPVALDLTQLPAELLDAGRVPGAVPESGFNWWYPAELMPGRDWSVSRGRAGGGSSATNGGYFIRPRRADFDRWSKHGDQAWDWDTALPVLRAIERDLDFGATAVHGGGGPVPVRRGSLDHPAASLLVDAAVDAGHRLDLDKNDEAGPGIGPVPSNAIDGVRWSTALTHLLPAVGRPNLEVRAGCTVTRVQIRGRRASGVEMLTAGGLESIAADEVVLAAGALASPVLLLRSGIGPADEIRRVGLEPAADLPGVGGTLSDHPQVTLDWRRTGPSPRPQGYWMGALLTATSSNGDSSGDIEVLQSLRSMAELMGDRVADPRAALPLLVSVNAPEQTGSIRLRAADHSTPAHISFGYLRDEQSRRRMREAVRVACDVVEGARRSGDGAGVLDLTPETRRDDRALDGWIRGRLGTALHTCATVPFRLQDGSEGPVDAAGRVRGVDGLRVADTSILPSAPLRGPAVAAVLVGELMAASMASRGSSEDPCLGTDRPLPDIP